MKHLNCTVAAIALVLLLQVPLTAQVETDPETLARECIEHIVQLADRCIDHNQTHCKRCVERIEALVAAGEHRRAFRVADECISELREHPRRCVQEIQRHCHRCVEALEQLDAPPELIERVKQACERQLARVRESRDRCIAEIREALPPQPDAS